MVLWCQGEKSGRVFLSAMYRINYKREKMKRPYPKTSYESWFYLQKLTLGTTSMLQAQINWGEHHYVSMQISKTLRREKKRNQNSQEYIFLNFCYFQLERIHWNACMKVARSLFFVLESTGPRREILPSKFRIHEWSVAQQRISRTESQAPGIFHIGFYIKFVKLE